MRGLGAVFGSRLHGSMAAIAAETPGVIIAHDSRTGELADTMHLPRLSYEDAMAAKDIADLAGRVVFDGAAFDCWRNETALRFRRLLTEAGVKPSVRLAGAVDQAEGRGSLSDFDESGRVFHAIPQMTVGGAVMPTGCDR